MRCKHLTSICTVHTALWSEHVPVARSPTEQRFMEASLAYTAKKPIISDDEYDSLKAQLREQSSKVVKQVGTGAAAGGRRSHSHMCHGADKRGVRRGHGVACAAAPCTATPAQTT